MRRLDSVLKLADSELYRVVPTLLKKCRYVHPILFNLVSENMVRYK